MGQQQTIIIILVIMIVGLAVFGGIQIFESSTQSNERENLIQQMTILVGEAQQYSLRTKNVGGGGGKFEGFVPMANLSTNERMTITTTTGSDWIIFQGFGIVKGWDGVNPVQVICQYRLSEAQRQTVNLVN
jgi:hypothetical protein